MVLILGTAFVVSSNKHTHSLISRIPGPLTLLMLLLLITAPAGVLAALVVSQPAACWYTVCMMSYRMLWRERERAIICKDLYVNLMPDEIS